MAKTAFFGGSFDPPHVGHLGVARGALASGRTEQVLFVPAFEPPHKANRRRASYADRLEMTRLAVAGESGMAVSEIEGRLRLKPSYTIDVLAALEAELGRPVQLLIGGDTLATFHLWYRARELAEKYEILTYPRHGETPDLATLNRNWPPELACRLHSGILPGVFFEISSTNLRNTMAKKIGCVHINNEVPEAVEEYIRKNHLYAPRGAKEESA